MSKFGSFSTRLTRSNVSRMGRPGGVPKRKLNLHLIRGNVTVINVLGTAYVQRLTTTAPDTVGRQLSHSEMPHRPPFRWKRHPQ